MAGTLVSYLPFTRSVTEDLSGKEWTVTGNPQIVDRPDFSVPVAKFEANEELSLENITVGGRNDWLMDFWIYIPQTSSDPWIIHIGEDDWFFTLLQVLSSGKLRLWRNKNRDLTGTTGYYEDTNETFFNKWINIKLSSSKDATDALYSSVIDIYVSDGTKWILTSLNSDRDSYTTKIGRLTLTGSSQMFISQFRFYTRSNTYYLSDFIPNPPTDSGNVNIYLPTRQSFAWNEFQVHDTVNFDYSDNINYTTTNNKFIQWYYKNTGTVDDLLVAGTSLTNVSPLKSVTSKAFYQTNRQKCFDTQASKEIYMLFDVYFDGTNQWRAYEESSTNGVTGITAQTSGVLNIFSNGTNVGASIPLTINKLETYLLHMRSDATNGYIEVYKDGELKYTYIGNVNNGDDFSNLELQSDGSGTIFSNIVISNQPVYDYNRWIGDYTHIQRTLTNETWIPAKCLKAGLPLNITQSINISWTATGNVSMSSDIKKEGSSSIHLPNGAYLVANDIININTDKWTFDCWAYLVSSSADNGYFALSAKTNDARYGIIVANDGIWIAATSRGWQAKNDSITFPSVKNQWVHLAIVKNGQQVTFYQDGVSVWSFTTSELDNSGAFILGGNYYGYDTDIYFDQVRFLKDTALWTENFIPPTTEDYETYQNSILSGSLDSTLNVWFPFDQIIPLSFTGQQNSYAELPLSVLPGATTFTIEAKFSTTSTNSKGSNYNWGMIAGRDISTSWKDDFGLCVNNGKLCFWAEPKARNSLTASSGGVFSNAVVNDGNIHKVAVVSSNGAIDLYCDGELVAHTDNVNAKITDEYKILIAYNDLQMDLYELRFWSVARTEIFATIDGTEEGLQGWYKPSQNGLLDYSGNNRHATIYNADYDLTNALKSKTLVPELKDLTGNLWNSSGTSPAITTINEVNGRAVQFGNGYLYTTPPELKNNNFTIDFWEYLPSTTNSVLAELVTCDGTNGDITHCIQIVYNSTTVPSLWLGKGTGSGWIYSNKIIGTKIRDQWVHRAVVRYNDKIYAFENGKLYTSFAIEPELYIDITGNSLFVGGFKRESRLFPGMLSEMRIHVGTALWTTNFTPPTQEDYFETYWYFNKPAPILNTNYNTLRYLTNNSKIWKYINPGYTDISPFTYTNSSVTPVQAYDAYTDMQLSGNINLNIDIYQELCIKFNISIGNALGTVFSFPYGKGTISISISKPESYTTYLAKIIHERNEENPIGIQLSPETSYSDYELGKVNEEISFIIYIKSDASNKGEIIINSSAWVDTDDNKRTAIFPSTERFHLYNANINEGNALLKILNSQGIYNLIVSNQQLTFNDMICQNINSTQLIVSNDEDWRREKYYWNTYLPFVDSVTKDFSGDTWTLYDTLVIQDNACYFDGSGHLFKPSTLDTSKPFTISFYMSATSNNTGGEPCIFQFYMIVTQFGIQINLQIIECKITSSGNLVFSGNFVFDKKTFALSTPFSILDGKMHYVECTYTGSKCLFFVDGMLIGTVPHVLKNANYGLHLGRNVNTDKIFTGYLKDFRIYQDYVLHTENFTPSPIMGNRLFYDKSAETMKFESFADIIKNVINIPLTIRNMFLRHYIPLHNDLDDKVNNVNTQFYSTIESVDAVFTNNSLNLQKYSSDGNEENNKYNGFGITNLTNLLKFKFILQARLFDVQFYRTPNGLLTNNIFSIFGQGFEQILLMVGYSNSLLFQADVGKRYSKSVSLINNFQLTIVYDYNNLQIIISSIDTNMDIIKTEVFYQIDLSQCQPDFNKNINEILFGSKVGSLGTPNAIHYLNEIKIYQDFNPDLSSNIIDNYITYQFNNNEESVYFEFYADIDLSKPMIINISPSILCWYYLQENKKLRIQGSQAFIPSDEFGFPKGVKDSSYIPSLGHYQFLDYRSNSNIVYALNTFYIHPQIDYLPYTLFFWTISNCSIQLEKGDTDTWEIYYNSIDRGASLMLYNLRDDTQTKITIAENSSSPAYRAIYHLALVLENSDASLYINGSYVETIYNLTFNDEWRISSLGDSMSLYGFGAIKGNIFKNGNVNLGYIGCPPSYAIGISNSQVSKPRLALQHNDKTYYNKLVLPTDENASKIRVYHNDTVYALSK